jgi:type III secretion protein T
MAMSDSISEFAVSGNVKDLLWPLLAAFPRLFGFWLAFPLLGQNSTPAMVRNGLTIAVALFAWPMVASQQPNPLPKLTEWFWLAPKEVLLGFSLGFSLGIVVWALESAGTLVDDLSGTNNAAQMDPSSGAPLGPTAQLAKHYTLTLLLVSGVLGHFLIGVVDSFRFWPWHAWWPDAAVLSQAFFMQRSALFWDLTLRFVAPVMLALLVAEIGLGLINRATPQFDVYRIGMPLKNLLAAFALAVTATFWAESAVQLFREDATALARWVQGTLQTPTR